MDWKQLLRQAGLLVVLIAVAAPALQAAENDEFDSYHIRISGFWFYSNPSGSFQGSADKDVISLQNDLGFGGYSTFSGKIDWKFTHKNHLYLVGSSYDHSSEVVLHRTITFQGQTFNVGLTARANLSAPMLAPGHQYDIIRRSAVCSRSFRARC